MKNFVFNDPVEVDTATGIFGTIQDKLNVIENISSK
jgi:hypothetical protein